MLTSAGGWFSGDHGGWALSKHSVLGSWAKTRMMNLHYQRLYVPNDRKSPGLLDDGIVWQKDQG